MSSARRRPDGGGRASRIVDGASPACSAAAAGEFDLVALAGDAAGDGDGGDPGRDDGRRGLRGGDAGSLRRHRQPAAHPRPDAHRERFAGRQPGQGHRGHRVLGHERDVLHPRPQQVHRQPAGPDAADRSSRAGRHGGHAVDVAAHRRAPAGPRRASGQRQLAAVVQEPGPDGAGAQTAGHRPAHRRRHRGRGGRDRRRHRRQRGAQTGGPADAGRRTGGANRRPPSDTGGR